MPAEMQQLIDAAFNGGLQHAYKVLQAEKKAQERKCVWAKRRKNLEDEEEATYAVAILERVAEAIQSEKRR